MKDQRADSALYAETFSRTPITGTRFLTFRDVPDLLTKYVNGTKTLDYGCGPGRSSIFLKSLGLDVEGVDINERMVSLSKELDPKGRYSVINSGELQYSDETYDLVYLGFVLPYVSTKNELVKIMKEIARVLKPGGSVIAIVTNENSYKYKWLVENFTYEENVNLVSGKLVRGSFPNITLFHYYWSDEDYCGVIEESGLKLVCTHRPLGKDSDGFAWINETKVGPSTMYVAKKPTG